jgi:hypothetical protein
MTEEHTPEEKDRIVHEEGESPKEAALGHFLQAKLDEGWTRDGRWRHPTDTDKWMLIDPFTGEVTFSAKFAEEFDADPDAVKYIEVVREETERKRRSGEL